MVLVKIGGSADLDFSAICSDIAELWQCKKRRVIVVHGASQFRNKIAEKLGIKIRKIVSASGVESYYSDDKFMDVFLMTYSGLINKKITAKLIALGVKAVGLSGIDGKLWVARRKKHLYIKEGQKLKLIKADLSGKIYYINSNLLLSLLSAGYLPVICSPAVSEKGEVLNVDNDAAIAAMIQPLKVKVLISLFSAPGFLRNAADENSLIKKIKARDLIKFYSSAQGTMKKKIIFAKKAFDEGLEKAYLGDGRIKQPIKKLFSGEGTIIES